MSQFHAFAIDGFGLTSLDDYGCQWTVEDIQGWFTGGAVRTSVQAKAQQNGDWRGTGSRGGRLITARGKVFCPDTTAMELASRRLSGVLSRGGYGEFSGSSAAGDLSARVQLEDMPLFDPQSSDWATWQITVASEDPLLYGALEFGQTSLASTSGGTGRAWPRSWPTDYGVPAGVTPGAVSMSNAGTADYWPTLRIDGPVPNPTVTLVETGDWIRLNFTVAAGQWVDIDCANRRVILNGDPTNSLRKFVTSYGSWLAVPPGGASISWSADAADPAASLSVWSYEGAWS